MIVATEDYETESRIHAYELEHGHYTEEELNLLADGDWPIIDLGQSNDDFNDHGNNWERIAGQWC